MGEREFEDLPSHLAEQVLRHLAHGDDVMITTAGVFVELRGGADGLAFPVPAVQPADEQDDGEQLDEQDDEPPMTEE